MVRFFIKLHGLEPPSPLQFPESALHFSWKLIRDLILIGTLEVEHFELESVLPQALLYRTQRLIHRVHASRCAAHLANKVFICPSCQTLV